MTGIDPTKLYAIFRALSKEISEGNKSNKRDSTKAAERSARSLIIRKSAQRDKEVLRESIKRRLTEIKSDENYKTEAPVVAIQEILLWEFGEDIINHPSFKQLSTSVAQQVTSNKDLKDYLDKFISKI